jgi:predicted phage tail protein
VNDGGCLKERASAQLGLGTGPRSHRSVARGVTDGMLTQRPGTNAIPIPERDYSGLGRAGTGGFAAVLGALFIASAVVTATIHKALASALIVSIRG